MRTNLRKRLEALESDAGGDEAERNAVAKKLVDDCILEWKRQDEAQGIKWPVIDPEAYRAAYDASKPANWSELSSMERTDHWVRFALNYQPSL